MGKAAETDVAYMEAAATSIKKGKWGMFCIPGVARLEHIDIAALLFNQFARIQLPMQPPSGHGTSPYSARVVERHS